MKFQSVILFLTTLFLFYSCEKELSYEGGLPGGGGNSSGTAVYTFDGGTGSCTGAVVSGTYTAGTALTATNTVTLQVNVTTIGTYILSSATVNGISFSGSGAFTTTGVQAITLTGAGTPAAAGTYNLTIGSNGCSFSVVVAGGGNTSSAVFTFDGGSGACTGAVSDGSYTVGTAVSASNTVTLKINVTTVGTYNISTALVNGIIFTGSGTFTNTGIQNLVLTATGTPAAAGDFNYTPTNGCQFTVTATTGGTPASDYYFDVTVNGERIIKHAEGTPGGYGLGYGTYGQDDVVYSSIISPTVDPIPAGMPYIDIGKGLFAKSATEAAFKTFFQSGNYSYAAEGSWEGISIGWADKDGKFWSSNNTPGTQTGSSFTLTQDGDYHDILGFYIVKFTAVFNCKLYDDAGNSITLTNGKFVGEFQKN